MAVKIVLGMTQSGKSFYVENYLKKIIKRAFVFDVMNCFRSISDRMPLDQKMNMSNVSLERAWVHAQRSPQGFKISFIPGRSSNYVKEFDKLISMALLLGDKMGPLDQNLLLVCDESSEVTSATMRSDRVRSLVTRGRHFNVDSLFIAQRPEMLHNDIKANASEVVAFNLNVENSFLNSTFGRLVAEKIKTLPRYHFVTWRNTGEVFFTDENGRKYGIRGGSGAN